MLLPGMIAPWNLVPACLALKKLGGRKPRGAQVGPAEVRVGQVRLEKISRSQHRARQVGAPQRRLNQDRTLAADAAEISLQQAHRTQVGRRQNGQIGLGEVGTGQVCTEQDRARQCRNLPQSAQGKAPYRDACGEGALTRKRRSLRRLVLRDEVPRRRPIETLYGC
jgi:hypothetical protein